MIHVFGEGSTAQNSSARKNCLTPKSRLFDTDRADVKKMKTARESKKRHFDQMRFLDQNEQLLKLQLLDKSIEKCQLLELSKIFFFFHPLVRKLNHWSENQTIGPKIEPLVRFLDQWMKKKKLIFFFKLGR